MAVKQLSLFCARCDEVMPHTQQAANHVAHGVGTVLTGGWWGVAWLRSATKKRGGAVCSKCGNVRSVEGPATIAQVPAIVERAPEKPMSARGQIIMWSIIVAVAVAGIGYGITVSDGW